MDPNNNSNGTYNTSIQESQCRSHSNSTFPDPSSHITTTPSTPSTVEYDMEIEEQMSLLLTETTSISSKDDDNRNEGQQEQQKTQHMASTLPQDWLPLAASTPLANTIASSSSSTRRSERKIENELFQNTENLIQEFLRRPNREYPYYRVMRWTIGEQSRLEHVLTVVINRTLVILE